MGAVVKPVNQTGAIAFDVRYALEGVGGVLGPWTIVTITRPKKVTISGLTLAGIYQFQIRALGVFGYYAESRIMPSIRLKGVVSSGFRIEDSA
jgi:hypothetical protein